MSVGEEIIVRPTQSAPIRGCMVNGSGAMAAIGVLLLLLLILFNITFVDIKKQSI